MKDLTIIVPVYNVQAFLKKCLDSLVNQKTTYSYEVICINDGSTDNSYDILKSYHQLYSGLIKIISQENAGVSSARNKGILASNSKFISFVDADDWVGENFVQNSLHEAIINNSDIVIQDVIYMSNKTDIYSEEKINKNLFNAENHIFNKTFRLKKIVNNNITFPEDIAIGEDMYFTFLAIMVSDKVTKINEANYYYRIDRQGSAMKTNSIDKYLEINKVCKYLYQQSIDLELYGSYQKQLEYLFMKNMVLRIIPKLIKVKKMKYKEIKKIIKNQFLLFKDISFNWIENECIVNDYENYFQQKLGSNFIKQLKALEEGNLILFSYNFIVSKIRK
ncbi:glycosyltransferase [Priestia megaterium]|uniref:glycosyltransferase family 2 protein n=1 Tax=Priestia megaterium TaxID=1404 RepID=UPI0030C92C81